MRHVWQKSNDTFSVGNYIFRNQVELENDYYAYEMNKNEIDADAFAMYYFELSGIAWKSTFNWEGEILSARIDRKNEIRLNF